MKELDNESLVCLIEGTTSIILYGHYFYGHKVFDELGNEVTNDIIKHVNEKNAGMPANIYQADFSLEVLYSNKLIPCAYHRYYYMEKEMLQHSIEEFNKGGTRAEQMKEVEKILFEIYKNPDLNKKPEELQKRGGAYYSDAACECINAIYNNKGITMVVSTKNNGAIPCLDDDSIVEISSIISSKGAEPIAWGKMGSFEKGWIQIMKAMEECTIEAALTGDYGKAMEAFVINPLITNGNESRRVLDELLVAHERYLPQFKEKIKELKKLGISSKDHIVEELNKIKI